MSADVQIWAWQFMHVAVGGMPAGLSFVGSHWSEAALLSYGYAYEQAGYKRVPPEAYKKAAASK